MKKGYFCKIQSVSKFNFQQIMADKKAQESLDPEVKIQSAIGNTENFIMRNGRKPVSYTHLTLPTKLEV